jgi:hypothetical protein
MRFQYRFIETIVSPYNFEKNYNGECCETGCCIVEKFKFLNTRLTTIKQKELIKKGQVINEVIIYTKTKTPTPFKLTTPSIIIKLKFIFK